MNSEIGYRKISVPAEGGNCSGNFEENGVFLPPKLESRRTKRSFWSYRMKSSGNPVSWVGFHQPDRLATDTYRNEHQVSRVTPFTSRTLPILPASSILKIQVVCKEFLFSLSL